jgi:hypothetical protein
MFYRPRYTAFLIIYILVLSIAPVSAENRFIDNGDGTVTDKKSGLMWAKTDNQQDITWKKAQKWVGARFAKTLYNRLRLSSQDCTADTTELYHHLVFGNRHGFTPGL